MSKLTLVLGGARSGKSRYGAELAEKAAAGHSVAYIATATIGDAEMAERIKRHQQDRPSTWRTIEEPLEVADALRDRTRGCGAVLIDCITLLLTNHLIALHESAHGTFEARVDAEIETLIAVARASDVDVIFVSNELGLGIVPEYPLARMFRDVAGRANQQLAAACDQVVFMVAGLPMVVKGQ